MESEIFGVYVENGVITKTLEKGVEREDLR